MEKKRSKANKEAIIFNKKADDSTLELIATREELNKLKEDKQIMVNDIDSIKLEFLSFIRSLTTNNIPQNHTIVSEFNLKKLVNEKKYGFESLNQDIELKKQEIDNIKYQKAILDLILTKEEIIDVINDNNFRRTQSYDELNNKTKIIKEKSQQITMMKKTLEDLRFKVNSCKNENANIENEIKRKNKELEILNQKIERTSESLDTLRKSERDLIKELGNLQKKENLLTKNDNEIYEHRMKIQDKIELMNKKLHMLNNECLKKENELEKLNADFNEKQLYLTDEKDELIEISEKKKEKKKELNEITDKLNRNKKENEIFEELKNTLENKISEQKTQQKQNDELVEKQVDCLKNYAEEIKSKELFFKKLLDQCKEKKDEVESLISYLNILKNDYQMEENNLNNLKVIYNFIFKLF